MQPGAGILEKSSVAAKSLKSSMQKAVRVPPRIFLPFLRSLLWQTSDAIAALTPEEMLNVYERGWRYRDTLESPTPEELNFIRELAAQFHSDIIQDV